MNQQAWVSAAEKIVHCYATHFKKTPFVLAWGKPVPGDNTDMQAVADYGRQFPLFGLKCDALSVTFPQFTDPEGIALLSANIVVMQAAHSGNVNAVISHGQTFGAAYLELYLP